MADQITVVINPPPVIKSEIVFPQGPQGERGLPGPTGPQGAPGTTTWAGITDKPSTFPPSSHTHTASEITDFSAAVVAAAPPTTNASLLTSGTLPDARLSAAVTTSLGKADTALQSGSAISSISGLQTALDGKQPAGSYASLVGGLVPSSQLPSYVDDVLEFSALAAFPATGETGKIYVATGTNKVYRWSGSAYVEIVAAPGSTDAVPEGSTNLYFTAARAVSALASTLASYATTAWVTAQGYATAAALNSAISALVTGVSSVAGKTGAVTLAKADVGLGNVDNTSDAEKQISLATQTALNGKAPTSHTHDDRYYTESEVDTLLSGKQAAGSYAPASGISPSAITGTAVVTTDLRLSDARTPTAHKSTHATGGADALTPADIGAATAAQGAKADSALQGSAGSVDNAILRADVGTGIVQNSGIIIDDAIVSFSVTGDAGTDLITATGHNFTANQGVMFPSLTGGSGLNTTGVYFVRDISGSTFKVSTTSGGAAVNFTTNITAGSVIAIQGNVAISQNTSETNSSLVLTPKGTGALIAGPKPDGTATGGNARGLDATDLQRVRGAATQIASGNRSFIGGGLNNTASGVNSAVSGGSGNSASGTQAFVGGGRDNVASSVNEGSVVVGGRSNSASGQYAGIITGAFNQASGNNSFIIGHQSLASGGGSVVIGHGTSNAVGGFVIGNGLLADRFGMVAGGSGSFASIGDAQRARFVLRCKTTTNTGVEMALDGGTTYLGIPNGKVIAMTINIAGISALGGVAHYVRQYAVRNILGTSSQVYAPVTIGSDNAAGTVIELSANDTDDTLRILVTGTSGIVWRWVASVDAVEIAYGT